MGARKSAMVFGAAGMVGSAIVRRLNAGGYRTHGIVRAGHDLTNQADVSAAYLAAEGADCAVIAAAKVGGIHANSTYPADFIYQNLLIEAHTIHQAYVAEIPRLIFLGSSCIYPKLSAQPIDESELLNGPLEPTNDAYAIAKIAGIKLCEAYNRQHKTDFRSLMPTNLYGPGDNYSGVNSHVIPALMKKFADAAETSAKEVVIWGTGSAKREFLHVDDLAKAVEFCLELSPRQYWSHVTDQQSHINIGTGQDISIKDLATLLKEISGFTGDLAFDSSKPDGTPRKLLNTRKIEQMGWHPEIDLRDGLESTYREYVEQRRDLALDPAIEP